MDMELGKENVDPEIQDIPKKLSLAKTNRFVYEEMCKGYVPLNTEKNTKWALKCFNEW